LLAGQSTGSFNTEGGAVFKTTNIAAEVHTFKLIDTYKDGIFYQYGASEFKITVNVEQGVISSSGEFGDVHL
jgi:hypothetical protein